MVPRQARADAKGPDGLQHFPGALAPGAQSALLACVERALAAAPPYRPSLPRSGRKMSVEMTNLGPLGWVSDRAGYRYQAAHPVTGRPWPPMPAVLADLWDRYTIGAPQPEACLVNLYGENSRLGLHVDADEAASEVPVLSISLGDPALFRIGGPRRRDPTRSFWLKSGDVLVLSGPARACHHGVDRIAFGESDLIPGGGRVNLTLRRVTRAHGSTPALSPRMSQG